MKKLITAEDYHKYCIYKLFDWLPKFLKKRAFFLHGRTRDDYWRGRKQIVIKHPTKEGWFRVYTLTLSVEYNDTRFEPDVK